MSVVDDRVERLLKLVDRPVSATEVSSVVGFGTFPVREALDDLVEAGEAGLVGGLPADARRYFIPKLEVVE